MLTLNNSNLNKLMKFKKKIPISETFNIEWPKSREEKNKNEWVSGFLEFQASSTN